MPQLADIIRVNDQNLADARFNNVFDRAPLLAAAEAVRSSNNTSHKYLIESGAPSVGFRAANTPRANTDGTEIVVTAELKILDASFDVDAALAEQYRDGAEAYIQWQASRYLRAAMFTAETTIINGGVADGFSGLAQAITGGTYFVDNEGATAPESVYLIHSAEEGFAVINNGELSVGESYLTRVGDAASGYDAYRTPIVSWMGLQIGAAADVVRIANVGSGAGEGLTDDLLYEAAAKMPSGKAPNLVVCSRRSQEQLRRSRVATTPTGAPVPTPTEVPGIGQLIVTDVAPA